MICSQRLLRCQIQLVNLLHRVIQRCWRIQHQNQKFIIQRPQTMVYMHRQNYMVHRLGLMIMFCILRLMTILFHHNQRKSLNPKRMKKRPVKSMTPKKTSPVMMFWLYQITKKKQIPKSRAKKQTTISRGMKMPRQMIH